VVLGPAAVALSLAALFAYPSFMESPPEQIHPAPALPRPEMRALHEDLRAISLRSAARLRDRELLTGADLYDEDGLPA
jgi:hypothetical protein